MAYIYKELYMYAVGRRLHACTPAPLLQGGLDG